MKYIGNFADWVNPLWITEILNNSGIQMPRDFMKYEKRYQPDFSEDRELSEEEKMHEKANFNSSVLFEMFDTLDVSFNFSTKPPFIDHNEPFCWWIVKLLPGQMSPAHIDKDSKDITIYKYWMPWTDWESGQAFLYEDKALTNWKMGDVWIFENPGAIHSAVNASTSTRIALQITNYRPARLPI
jgi:hypothetical protein